MSGEDNIIEVENLTKTFGEFTAVDAVSFSVKRGERFAFLGPNGAGKSTTIKMLTTLLDPSAGSIRVAGFDPQKDAKDVRKSFGIVFQDPSLDDELTAEENMQFHAILYGLSKKERDARIKELLTLVELYERRGSLVKEYSGGMKRRLEIARGLLHHPKIIFLDEPTLGLDPQTRNRIWEYLKEKSDEGVTVFFTTHYMDEADKAAERIAVIDHGTIIAVGSGEELKKQTNTASLEDAFLALTGRTIREEEGNASDRMRMAHRARTRR